MNADGVRSGLILKPVYSSFYVDRQEKWKSQVKQMSEFIPLFLFDLHRQEIG